MIKKPSFVGVGKLTLSWPYPCYCRLQQLRPLPVTPEKAGSRDCEYESGSESDSGSFTFLPTESSSSRSSRKLTKKKHKGRRSSSGDDDSDQEPSRTPLSETIHVHRQVQRLNSHPNMAKTRKRATQEKDEENATEKENAELKLKLARIMKRQKLDRTATSGAAAASGTSKAMTREVGKVTKTKLWKVCKFFKNDNKVRFRSGCFGSCFYCTNFAFYTFTRSSRVLSLLWRTWS